MLWQPGASIETLHQRAAILIKIRNFFNERGYLEVETPIMARFGVTDVYLSNIKAGFRGQEYFLQTSPEYHMKRLLAAGSGAIFQLARVFRDDELGRWHNPEFTLLEWYQLDSDHHQAMQEVNTLLQLLLHCPALVKKTYQQVFQEVCDIDPLSASLTEFRSVLERFNLANVLNNNEDDRDQYLFLLMSHVIEPNFSNLEYPLAVYHFPPTQAALAQINNGIAERFEVYFRGVELANGFHELTDVQAQTARFYQDITARQQKDLPTVAIDEWFLSALPYMPACSGVALGIDRLIALALHQTELSTVLAFDLSRA